MDSPRSNAFKTGPPLVGIILNWWLFGIFFMQYLFYLSHGARKDKKIIRAIVHLLFLLDAVQSILALNDAFRWFVFNFGNYGTLSRSGLHGIDGPLPDGIIAMVVQFVYCWRIWVLSQWKVFPIIIAFLAFTSGAGGILDGIYTTATNLVDDIGVVPWYISAMLWLWPSVVTDIAIATTMAYLLRFKSRGCSQGIKAVVKRLLILTLETNALTAIAVMVTATLGLFPALEPPFTNLHRLGGYTLGKLYSNCFMVLLNQRIYYEKFAREERTTIHLGTLEFANSSSRSRSGITNPAATDEVSIVRFCEVATQAEVKSRHGDDIELGQA